MNDLTVLLIEDRGLTLTLTCSIPSNVTSSSIRAGLVLRGTNQSISYRGRIYLPRSKNEPYKMVATIFSEQEKVVRRILQFWVNDRKKNGDIAEYPYLKGVFYGNKASLGRIQRLSGKPLPGERSFLLPCGGFHVLTLPDEQCETAALIAAGVRVFRRWLLLQCKTLYWGAVGLSIRQSVP